MPDRITDSRRPPAPGEPGIPGDVPGPGGRGQQGVFTGAWLAEGCDCHPYTAGYAGRLVRSGAGGCVFRTSRAVAGAVVAGYQHALLGLVFEHTGQGAYLGDAWLAALEDHPSITWLGPLIIADRRLCTGDDAAVDITVPDAVGLYTIGWGLSWERVDTAAVHTVHRTPHT
ncbi:hypothetical protein [Mangrovihabitans endophyticus]|uniref:Uncharacterized protein n=1 Tax=Mangrovihabitans endophyticus TaxID=1751298 RepID=A0A8J3FR46_9ACTN|nr:hypothetical protein [Mangrovihabitans endophyticus]GGL12682.1 hypothetical protein GCM10012284_54240 [Mangrovihabitans endophyticus]